MLLLVFLSMILHLSDSINPDMLHALMKVEMRMLLVYDLILSYLP